jgi:hypothetical protein
MWKQIGATGIPAKDVGVIREAAKLDPAFAARVGIKVGAVSDYEVQNFVISDWAKSPVPGDDVFVDVQGDVYDVLAGLPDYWQICVAVAAVDVGNDPTALKTFKTMSSSTAGYPYPLSNHIKISDPANPFHSHLVIGKMPSSRIIVWVELFANHDAAPAWDWSLWQRVW